MIITFDNKLLSSFLTYVDSILLNNGQAFTNYSGSLYRATGNFDGLYTYTTPFKQLVNDSSVAGASIMSGLWVNGVFSMPGQNGLHSINITEGQAYFTNTPTTVSGNYAIKDFSAFLTTLPEESLLFETKLYYRSKVPQIMTGLPQTAQTFPALYIKSLHGENTPFCLGGTDNNEITYRVMVIGDSQFITDAACSILKATARKRFKVLEPTGLPFNSYGAMTGVNFNYNNISNAASQEALIWKVRVSQLFSSRELNQLNPNIFPAFVDFDIWSIRGP